jgi:hypothetical protein
VVNLATDEPAREYARPTESCKIYHRQNPESFFHLSVSIRVHPWLTRT